MDITGSWMSCLTRLLDGVGASLVFLDDTRVGSPAADFTYSFEDFPDRHGAGGGESGPDQQWNGQWR